jgi:hypothetical protein
VSVEATGVEGAVGGVGVAFSPPHEASNREEIARTVRARKRVNREDFKG